MRKFQISFGLPGVAALLAMCLATPVPVLAVSDEARCVERQLREAGRYAFCRMKAQSKAARSGELPTGSEVLRCADKFTARWDKNNAKFGSDCRTVTSSSTMEPLVATCIDDLSRDMAGVTATKTTTPDLPGQGSLASAETLAGPSRCLSRELKDTGKFVSCRLSALGKEIKTNGFDNASLRDAVDRALARLAAEGVVPRLDAEDCDAKFDRNWTRTTDREEDCTNAFVSADVISIAEACMYDAAVTIAAIEATTTTTLPPPACGSGGPCSAFVLNDPMFCDAFGGPSGLDALCQASGDLMAPRPYARAFVGWISDSGTDAVDRLTPGAGPYVSTCPGNPEFAADLADMTDGVTGAPLVCNSVGSGVVPLDEFRQVWTGTLGDGTWSGLDCDDWSDRNVEAATTGIAILTGEFEAGAWTEGAERSEFPALFYCMEVPAP